MTKEELNEAIRYLEEERLIVEAILYEENQDKFDNTIMLIDDANFRESRKPLTIYDMAIKALKNQINVLPYAMFSCPYCGHVEIREVQKNDE